jgi:hypothetical protein
VLVHCKGAHVVDSKTRKREGGVEVNAER